MLQPNFEFQHVNLIAFASNLLHYGCLPSISLHNIYYQYFMPITCLLCPYLNSSWFTSPKSLIYAYLTSSTPLVENEICTQYSFHPLNLELSSKYKLNPQIRSQHQFELSWCRPSILFSKHMPFTTIPWWPITTRITYLF